MRSRLLTSSRRIVLAPIAARWRHTVSLLPLLAILLTLPAPARGAHQNPGYVGDINFSGVLWSVGVNPITNRILLTGLAVGDGFADEAVTVVDGATNQPVCSIPLAQGSLAYRSAVNATTGRAYVAHLGGQVGVSVVEIATCSVIGTVPIPDPDTLVPQNTAGGIAVNPNTNRVYVTFTPSGRPGAVAIIDGSTNRVVGTVDVESAGGLTNSVAVNANTNRIYVTNSDSLSVIDGASGGVSSIQVSRPANVAVNPLINRVYVTSPRFRFGTPDDQPFTGVTVLDGHTNGIIGSIPLGGAVGVGVNPNTNRIYVSGGGDATDVYVIEGAGHTVAGSLPLLCGNSGDVAVDSTSDRVYIATNCPRVFVVGDGIVAPESRSDLALAKSDSPDPVIPGSPLTYSLVVTNRGPAAAVGVTVTDVLPVGATLVSVASSQGTCSGTSAVTCSLGNLVAGGTVSVTIVLNPTVDGTLTNSASVTSTTLDPDLSNNTALATTTVVASGTDLVCDNLWNIRFFRCDFGHENNFALQRDGTPVCGSGNCPGPPNSCWGPPVTQRSFVKPGDVSWTIGALGALTCGQDRDVQVYGDTFLFVASPKTLTVPVLADAGRVWLNGVDVTASDPPGHVTLSLVSGWNHVELTSYNQHQGANLVMNFPFASQADRMDSTANSACRPGDSPPTGSSQLFCGDVVSGAITGTGATAFNLYTFDARAGEVVSLTLAKAADASSAFDPRWQLLSPSGTLIASCVAQTACQSPPLPANGTYTVKVFEFFQDATGPYLLSLEAVTPTLNGAPSCGRAISCGDMVAGEIGSAGEADTFSFNAQQGEVTSITLAKGTQASTSFDPRWDLFSPSGTLITSCVAQTACQSPPLPTNGTYTIKVFEFFQDATGPYALSLGAVTPTLNGTPNCSQAIACGQVVAGEIGTAGETDTFGFSGRQGEVVSITLAKTVGAADSFDPRWQLFSPSGTLITSCVAQTVCQSPPLPTSGTYTIKVFEFFQDATGAYTLSMSTPACGVAGDIGFTPTALDFGTLVVGSRSASQTVTVRNDGAANLVIETIALQGAGASQFGKGADSCSGQTLSPAQQCNVSMEFQPTSPGAKAATLVISSSDPDENPVSIGLSGSATAGAPSSLNCAFAQPSIVSISGRRLMVQRRRLDGSVENPLPYTIKGVNWAPASRGSGVDDRQAQYAPWFSVDLPLMSEMNTNTIRVFLDFGVGQTACDVLDELHRRKIMAIVTVDKMINDTANITSIVTAYKNHPAILMWSLGNEWNVNHPSPYFGAFADIQSAAEATELAARQIKALDTNHPVASSFGDIHIPGLTPLLPTPGAVSTQQIVNAIAPSVDVWGVNIFRGATFGSLFAEWASVSTKPMFIGEFGTDAFNQMTGNVDQAQQAAFTAGLWDEIAGNLASHSPPGASSGGLIFEWNDEWWKAGNPSSQDLGGFASGGHYDGFANEEWFGLVDIDRNKRQTFFTLRSRFAEDLPPELTLTLNKTTALPGESVSVRLEARNPGPSFAGDFYLGVLRPDGSTVMFFTNVSPPALLTTTIGADPRTFPPLVRNVFVPQGLNLAIDNVVSLTFSGTEPAGTYSVFAVLTGVGALDDGTIDARDLRVVAFRHVTFSP